MTDITPDAALDRITKSGAVTEAALAKMAARIEAARTGVNVSPGIGALLGTVAGSAGPGAAGFINPLTVGATVVLDFGAAAHHAAKRFDSGQAFRRPAIPTGLSEGYGAP